RSGESSFEIVAAAGSALVLLVASGGLREPFLKVIDRRFYREKYKFDRAMRQIEVTFESLIDRGALSCRFLQATSEVIRADWGAIYLRDTPNGAICLQASEGPEPDVKELLSANPLIRCLESRASIHLDEMSDSSDDRLMDGAKDVMISLGAEMAVGLESGGKLEGFLILGPKPSGLPYDAEEIAFVRALGSVAGLGLNSVEMRTTLEQANKELKIKVDKIAEQQRRILVLQDQLSQKGVMLDRSDEDVDSGLVDPDLDSSETTILHNSDKEDDSFASMIGSSQSLRDCIRQAKKVSGTSSAVLIRGESGTGKEVLAKSIHKSSARSEKPFVAVHCASLTSSLLESELFGHSKGAFTGADRDRTGRFEQANGGTIFLDEIGDISLETQIKLLRVLQEKTFERVGSSQSIKVDVRVIAATHRDLESMIQEGSFREDLYYRLNVITLRMPALRERKEDVFALAIHFLNMIVNQLKKPVSKISHEAVEQLVAYDWPGNIRQLENCIERAIVLTEGDTIRPEDLPLEIQNQQNRPVPQAVVRSRGVKSAEKKATIVSKSEGAFQRAKAGALHKSGSTSKLAVKREIIEIEEEAFQYERVQLLDALRDAGGNRSQAARFLGIPRTTMISRMKRHGLM
ncbi:MAG: Transcriptional regulatory protein ZraR, partial [Planctomycetota bacterium]